MDKVEEVFSGALKAVEDALHFRLLSSFPWVDSVRDMKYLTGLLLHKRLQMQLQQRPPLPSSSLWAYYNTSNCSPFFSVAAGRLLLLLLLEPQLMQHVRVYRGLCKRMQKYMRQGSLLASPLRLLFAFFCAFDFFPMVCWPAVHWTIYRWRCFFSK